MKSNKQFNKEFVSKTFIKLYLTKWKAKGKNEQQLSDQINDLCDDEGKVGKCTNKLVSRWVTGKLEPVKYIPEICKLFDVSIDTSIPASHDDRYQYSSDFTDNLERKMEKIAEDNFGIDLSFVQGMRNLIPDFDTRFPVCTPLQFREFDSEGIYFKRPEHHEAAPTHKNYNLLQITRNGKHQMLSLFDLKILKEVQQKVVEYIYSIFDETAEDIKLKEKEANTKYIEANTNIWVGVRFSDEELQEIDPYGFYSNEERRKYHLSEKQIETEEEIVHGNG